MAHQEINPIAVLDPRAPRARSTQRLIGELGLTTLRYDRTSELVSAMTDGQQFAMLVIFFTGRMIEARVELEYLLELSDPRLPLMLLMEPHQVEIAFCVMHSQHHDFLLAPFTNRELRARIETHYSTHALVPRLGADEASRPPVRRIAARTRARLHAVHLGLAPRLQGK